jgi:two-component system, NarL family, response regulator FusR
VALSALPAPYTVLCIDDNVGLVDALERRLSIEPDFGGLYRVDDFDEAVRTAADVRATVVILDVDLPGGVDALALLDGIVAEAPDSRVIMFTGYPTDDIISESLARGAWGFVSKGTSSDTLIQSIRRVIGGESVVELDD